MPVITRSQANNVANVTQPSMVKVSNKVTIPKALFVNRIKNLLEDNRLEINMEKRMIISLKIYKLINRYLNELILAEGITKWFRFTCTIVNKCYDFISQYRDGQWEKIDKKLVETFMYEINRAKIYAVNIILKYNENESSDIVFKTKQRIAAFESLRPRRNIKLVDYTGMDCIAPEGEEEFWSDTTIEEDPDYEFEEEDDEDDDDDDDYDDESM